MEFQETVKRNFKKFNSISSRNGLLTISTVGRGIDTFEFASLEAMQQDDLGSFFIEKMNREQKKKVGL